jgi:lysophospholipase L1-like esterase
VRLRHAASAALLLGFLPALAAGQTPTATTYIAFGDSITYGIGDDPSRAQPGYPPRLQSLLVTAGVNATVINEGMPGEKTPDGLTRIDGVLSMDHAKAGDVLLLMEGTNDVTKSISMETTIFDLDAMAGKAEALGMSVVHATVIPRPPWAKVDADNLLTEQLNGRIRNLAGVRGRKEADPNETFLNLPNLFSGFYSTDPTDFVGHPNAAGYDILARVFYNVIQGIDTVSPVPGILNPVDGSTGVSPDTTVQVEVWDFGAGIDLANTFLLIDGQPVTVTPQGTSLHATLSYPPPTPWSGTVTVGLQSQDLATPPNTINRQIASFTVQGSTALPGDVNGDGRVDGMDLVLFGLHFGAQRGTANYLPAADFNNDGVIDGLDLAILAAHFGQGTP